MSEENPHFGEEEEYSEDYFREVLARYLGGFYARRDAGEVEPETPAIDRMIRDLPENELRTFFEGYGLPADVIDGLMEDIKRVRGEE